MKDFFVNIFNTVWDSVRWAFLTFRIVDVLDILVVAFIIYEIIIFVRSSRAKTLIKGILFIVLMWMLSSWLSLNMTTWLFETMMSVGILALIVLFQPEIRHALENLGQTRVWRRLFSGSQVTETLSTDDVEQIAHAVEIMSKAKTGALICIEETISLDEFIKTGLPIGATISQQLLVNIFEKNTPLHDGALIIRDHRVQAATCYLPLSQNDTINKALGTRHRAGLGLSEVSDSRVVIVSEETGAISMAMAGQLYVDVDLDFVVTNLTMPVEMSESTLAELRGKLSAWVIKNKQKQEAASNAESVSDSEGGSKQ